jgi:hypothetical protein
MNCSLLIMKYFVSNGLSDHEAQLLIVHLHTPLIKKNDIYYTRTANNYNIADFRMKLVMKTGNRFLIIVTLILVLINF